MTAAGDGRRALIVGAGGQDGSYLARHLLARNVAVWGTSRRTGTPANLARLGIADAVSMMRLPDGDDAGLGAILRAARPDRIYWLAAQSSVGASFARPREGLDAAADFAAALAMIQDVSPEARILFAGSGECFGETIADDPARADSAFDPRSPYALGKCAGALAVRQARVTHRQHACTAFLFSHDSPLREESFVLGKVTAAVARIAAGSGERLPLGDVDVVRDWGWAPDYAIAMATMLAHDAPADRIVATGRSAPLADLVAAAFDEAGLDWRDHVDRGSVAPRPGDVRAHHADPSALAAAGWRATVAGADVARLLVRARTAVDSADRTGSDMTAKGGRAA